MSANELAFAEAHLSAYRLARIFNYNGANNSGGLYVLDGVGRQAVPLHQQITGFRFKLSLLVSRDTK